MLALHHGVAVDLLVFEVLLHLQVKVHADQLVKFVFVTEHLNENNTKFEPQSVPTSPCRMQAQRSPRMTVESQTRAGISAGRAALPYFQRKPKAPPTTSTGVPTVSVLREKQTR